VPEAFAKYIREHGGIFWQERFVDKILVENNAACGVRVTASPIAEEKGCSNGFAGPCELRARYVISMPRARQTFHKLVRSGQAARRLF